MQAKDLEGYRRLLLGKQREVLACESKEAVAVPAAGHIVGDLGDQAVAERETRVQVRLRQSNDHLLRAIREALERICTGNYGICQACERPIPDARLRVVPWTRFCRDCKEHAEV